MGRSLLAGSVLGLLLLGAGSLAFAGDAVAVPNRIVKLGAPLAHAETWTHLDFSHVIGFNAVWLPCRSLGESCIAPPSEPLVGPAARLHGWAKERDVELWVAVRSSLRGSTRKARKAQLKHFRARMEAGQVDRWIILGDPQAPTAESDPSSEAYDQVSIATTWAREIAKSLPPSPTPRVWLRINSETDHDLTRLPTSVGLVLSIAPGADVSGWVQSLGEERALVLEEPYPANGDPTGDGIALQLGAIRDRDAALAARLTGYVASPMSRYLGGSRLSLLTAAAFLRDPLNYNPEQAWTAAIERLAGADPQVRDALKTQAIEWGGWYGDLNWRPYSKNNVRAAAAAIRDPAGLASYTWTAKRYAERMETLGGLRDPIFAADLLRVMERRLVVARALPLIRALRQGDKRRSVTPKMLRQELRNQRAAIVGNEELLQTLDGLLEAAKIPVDRLLADPSPAQTPANETRPSQEGQHPGAS